MNRPGDDGPDEEHEGVELRVVEQTPGERRGEHAATAGEEQDRRDRLLPSLGRIVGVVAQSREDSRGIGQDEGTRSHHGRSSCRISMVASATEVTVARAQFQA